MSKVSSYYIFILWKKKFIVFCRKNLFYKRAQRPAVCPSLMCYPSMHPQTQTPPLMTRMNLWRIFRSVHKQQQSYRPWTIMIQADRHRQVWPVLRLNSWPLKLLLFKLKPILNNILLQSVSYPHKNIELFFFCFFVCFLFTNIYYSKVILCSGIQFYLRNGNFFYFIIFFLYRAKIIWWKIFFIHFLIIFGYIFPYIKHIHIAFISWLIHKLILSLP